jgi:hypothetical protein
MPAANEKLAEALSVLRNLQVAGKKAIRSADLTETVRTRLVANGFLEQVMKGWYIPTQPGAQGETTAWYTSFWDFCRDYLNERFGTDWCLTPEQSLVLLAGNTTVPRQLLVRASSAGNKPTSLLHGTSIFESATKLPPPEDRTVLNGLSLYTTEAAFIAASPDVFSRHPVETRTLLSMQPNADALLRRLLSGGHTRAAGRLAGGFTNIGRPREAAAIVAAMAAADHVVTETDPFTDNIGRIPYQREPSPYVQRIRLMWQTLRPAVTAAMPASAPLPVDIDAYMTHVDDTYVSDAYHSLSIEGYQVSADLIERVRTGTWNPKDDDVARNERNALAARGYWLAFQAVKTSVRRILAGENPGEVAGDDHGSWYQQLFQPSVAAGIIKPESLAGYRSSPVYIRGSMHTPLKPEAVPDAMSIFLELLTNEEDPAVRAILGHFVYVYIHPYMDGNGRTGRFLMNVMLAAAGHPWLVIPVQARADYMAALEAASVGGDIGPFSRFIASRLAAPVPEPR